ncbi:hypothetical protein LCER1_G003129 [Lachnellula cervina]|uniref:Myocyte-specific enhancer factor 2d n=1 Tax=Lachnellula cervina TaxID=1316786 RepID=A0A7D8UZR8_9HELO|nr:hypothetical protein LCER1_G003129 [Lachnellula cervina]
MDGQIRDIPGYYYDKEKRKYFKIETKSPAGSAYSSQDVKRRKTVDDDKEKRAKQAIREQGRICRSKILEASLAGQILSRELGQCHGLDAAQLLSGGLVPQGRLPAFLGPNCNPLFTLFPRTDLGPSMVDIRLARGDVLSAFRMNVDKTDRSDNHGSIEICHGPLTTDRIHSSQATRFLQVFGNGGRTTSLNMNEPCGRVVTTWLSGSTNSGIAITNTHHPRLPGAEPDEEFSENISTIFGPGLDRGSEPNIFSSTAAPPDSPYLFAFGSSYGILGLRKSDFSLSWFKSDFYPRGENPSDVFALEFLADNHNILLSGGRKGILNIADLRVPNTSSEDVITHPSCITHIRQLDNHRIIVAGLNSHLCQYDLRFRKLTSTVSSRALGPKKHSSIPKSRRRDTSINNQKTTLSTLQYPDFKNDSTINTGFDIDLETGTVAAAQEWDSVNPPVQLFSLHGGHKVCLTLRPYVVTPHIQMPPDFVVNNPVRCLKFCRDIEGRMKSLYVGGSSHSIQRFAWVGVE